MNEIAVPHASVKRQPRVAPIVLAPIVLFSAAVTLLVGLVSPAIAAPVAKDGKIYACYKVKGKPRGAMRVLVKGKRCKRGERKVAWAAAGPSASAGGNGSGGQSGANGVPGSNEAVLAAKVSSLTLKVESLENLLDGVEGGDLTGMMGTLNGVTNTDLTETVETVKDLTNADLTEAVGAVPAVEDLCTQAPGLTEGINDLGTGITGLTVLGLPGLSLGTASLPDPLDPFACPAF